MERFLKIVNLLLVLVCYELRFYYTKALLFILLILEFGIKTFEIDDKVIKVTIWDTAGQDRFKCLTKG